MDQVFLTALSLLRQTFSGKAEAFPEMVGWEAVLKELQNQTVAALPTDLIGRMADEPTRKKQRMTAIGHISAYQMHLGQYIEISRLLRESAVPFVFIKGITVARYYPQPEYRTLGDIDILVSHNAYDQAKQVLLQAGFRQMECPYEKHDEFARDGIIVELHKYFVSTNDVDRATYMEQLIQAGVESPEIWEVAGCTLPVLPPVAEGLMLLEHMSQHLESGIGLRHLVDWMMYASHILTDQLWEERFATVAGEAGLKKLAEVATGACVGALGMAAPAWCMEPDDAFCNRFLEHIAARGNFGNKDTSNTGKAQKVISTNRHLMDWFRYLQETGLRYMPFIRKHRILHPVAWLCRGAVLLGRLVKNGTTLKELKLDSRKAAETDAFLDALGIRRVSKGRTFWSGDGFIFRKR